MDVRSHVTHMTWLGHAGFLLESQGSLLAIDPWRSGPTWSRTPLEGLDLVAVSHGHFDHVEDVPAILKETGATGVAIFEVAHWLKEQGVPPAQVVDMNKGGTFQKDGWSLTMVDAVHSGGCPTHAPGSPGAGSAGSSLQVGGEAAGWIIRTPDKEVLYHAGDTTVFGDMAIIAKLYKPKLALLPIGGHYTMGTPEAAEAVRLLKAPHIIPMHYGTFPLLSGSPEDLRWRLPKTSKVHALRPGEKLDVSGLLKTKPKVPVTVKKKTQKAGTRKAGRT